MFGSKKEPNLTKGDIDLYKYRVDYGEFQEFGDVLIKDNLNQPYRILCEPCSVYIKDREVMRNLSCFFSFFNRASFEEVIGVSSTDGEWDDFLDHLSENGFDALESWFNQYVEQWRLSRNNSEKSQQAA